MSESGFVSSLKHDSRDDKVDLGLTLTLNMDVTVTPTRIMLCGGPPQDKVILAEEEVVK